MNNEVIPKAIELVKQAIEADTEKDYAKAYPLYKKALEYFVIGLKYEPPEKRKIIEEKLPNYMDRAESLKKILEGDTTNDGGKSSTLSRDKEKDNDGGDDETNKLRSNLASAIVAEKPNIRWDDVAGLEGAKQALKEAVILPTKFPNLFVGKRRPWKGILLFGPPGTGKSFLAKAVATEADSTFFSVSSSDLVSKWQGESERLVKQMFEMAREQKPSIIFIDEIDSLCTARSEGESESSRRIKTEFLVQMDGVGSAKGGLLVLGATNVPWELDPAMRRRFEKRVYIALPEGPARATMFKLNIADTPNTLTQEDFDRLGMQAEGYSGSDIAVVAREALMEPIRKCQSAKQFIVDTNGGYHPCIEYPNCMKCPMALNAPMKGEICAPPQEMTQCRHCGAVRTTLYNIESNALVVPLISAEDFSRALGKAHSSVGVDELQRFIDWTEEFGQEG